MFLKSFRAFPREKKSWIQLRTARKKGLKGKRTHTTKLFGTCDFAYRQCPKPQMFQFQPNRNQTAQPMSLCQATVSTRTMRDGSGRSGQTVAVPDLLRLPPPRCRDTMLPQPLLF